MIYFKALKNFPFGNNIPVIIEVENSQFNFLTNEWTITASFYLKEEDLITNKVKKAVSNYIVEGGSTIEESKLQYLINEYIDTPNIASIDTRDVVLFFAPTSTSEYPLSFSNLPALKSFLLNALTANPLLLEVKPESLKIYEETLFTQKVVEARDKVLNG